MVNSKRICGVLDTLLTIDQKCITNLIEARVECNEGIANHKHVTVISDLDSGKDYVGILGVINGILTSYGEDKIYAVYDDNENVIGFDCVMPDLPKKTTT